MAAKNAQTRVAANVSMENNEKTKLNVSKVNKWLETFFCVQLSRLSNHNCSISWTLYAATQLTSSSHYSVSIALYRGYDADFCIENDSSIDPYQKVKIDTFTIGN